MTGKCQWSTPSCLSIVTIAIGKLMRNQWIWGLIYVQISKSKMNYTSPAPIKKHSHRRWKWIGSKNRQQRPKRTCLPQKELFSIYPILHLWCPFPAIFKAPNPKASAAFVAVLATSSSHWALPSRALVARFRRFTSQDWEKGLGRYSLGERKKTEGMCLPF